MVKWGIIGCGDVCEVKSGPAFYKVNGSELIAVMRRDIHKAADFARRHQVNEHYSNADKIINHPEINAVYIATPPAFHEKYALACIEAGKNVYIEKPVALNAASCRKIANHAEKGNVKATVAHYRRELPYFLKVKQLLNSNVIGKIRAVQIKMAQPLNNQIIASSEANWRVVPQISGGGLFYDLAPHQLDIIYWLFGTPYNLSGYSANHTKLNDVSDTVTLSALLPNEISFQGIWLFNSFKENHCDTCTIHGEKGLIRFSFFRKNELFYENEKQKETIRIEHPHHIQMPFVCKVVDYFSGKGENPCSLNEAIVSMEMIDATLDNC